MEIRLIGEVTNLRSVKLEDALFVSQLRSDPKVYEYLSSSSIISLEQQQNWLKNQKEVNDGQYFIIENSQLKKSVGTVSIYNLNIEKREAEFGRYISFNSINAIEAEYLVLQFFFHVMCFDSVYCRTAENNTKVWKQHLLFGFENSGFEELETKNLLLRRQTLNRTAFLKFDYSKITHLINKFKKQ